MEHPAEGSVTTAGILSEAVGVSRGPLRAELSFARSVFVYRSLFDNLASPQRLGLSEEDLATAWPADGAATVTYRLAGGGQVDLPLIVPAERLHWYNADFFEDYFGKGRPIRYYTHVPAIRGGDPDPNETLDLVEAELAGGAVIITDCYAGDSVSTEFDAWKGQLDRRRRLAANVATLHGEDSDGILSQFVGTVSFRGVSGYSPGVTFYEQFLEARNDHRLEDTVAAGVEVIQTIGGEEAERLWEIYGRPFDALSGGHALRAGFDRRGFIDAMGDPEVVKVVRRAAGDITTLCLFVMNLDHCPWLNAEFYEEHYADAFHTRNILIFTAVVSDENVRGSSYAPGLIRVLTEVAGMRGTTALITFECNGISTRYLPRIVRRAISQARGATVSGLEQPVSRLAFKAIAEAR